MATYSAQSLAHAGTQITWQTPATGDLAPTGPANYLIVFNGSASPITVTLPFTPTYDGQGITSRTVTVNASTLAAPVPQFIPLPSNVYGAGTTTVNYSTTTTVSVAVISPSTS
jgi:hypothetical protein